MDPTDGTIAMIVNPRSGHGGRKVLYHEMYEYLKARGFSVEIYRTRSLGDARDLAIRLSSDPDCAMVMAAGGDGTAREAAEGLAGSGKTLMLIPAGTENLLACELDLDDRVPSLIRTFERGQIKTLDLGMVNGRCFACVVGVGFDGQVVHRVGQRRSGHIDYYDYLEPLWHTFWSYKFPPLEVALDGRPFFSGRGLVFVGNVSRYAMGLHLLARADATDGMLDVCIYRCGGRAHLVKHSVMTVLKRHLHCGDVLYARCRSATVTAPARPVPCEMDGDPGPDLPLSIQVRPAALKVLAPSEGRPIGLRRSLLRAFR